MTFSICRRFPTYLTLSDVDLCQNHLLTIHEYRLSYTREKPIDHNANLTIGPSSPCRTTMSESHVVKHRSQSCYIYIEEEVMNTPFPRLFRAQ